MNSDNFMELAPKEQVIFINKLLETRSLTQICIDFKIAKNILKYEFINLGYIYDMSKKQFVLENDFNQNNDEIATSINRHDSSYQGDKTLSVLDNSYVSNSSKSYNTNIKNMDSISSKISKLEKEIMDIKEILNKDLIKTDTISNNIDIKTYDSSTLVPRTYKIDSDIQQQFKLFCKQNNKYKVSDLVTNALLEYMNKFKQ